MRACSACGWAGAPKRDICPRCSARTWSDAAHVTGVVRAMTTVHRAFGQALSPAPSLALVELDVGGWIVGTGVGLAVGTTVEVGDDLIVRTT